MAGPLLMINLLLQFSAIAISHCHKHPQTQPNITALFTFGDSFLDTGNNNYLDSVLIKANHAPYGHSFPGRISTGRFSDGKILSDFLASGIGVKNVIPPFGDPNLSGKEIRTGVGFASAGSGYDDLTTLLTHALPVSKQVSNFAGYVRTLKNVVGEVAAKNVLRASLAVVAAGTDDLLANVYQTPARQIQYGLGGYQDFLHQKIHVFITNLYNKGVRNFMVAGLPPIGCLPIQRATKLGFQHCVEDENFDSQTYNKKLITFLPKIQANLPGSKIVYADIYTPIMDMVSNPAKYGLAVTDRGCCGTGLVEASFLCKELSPVCPNPNQYLFWDAVNPSEAAHKVLAQFLLKHSLPQFHQKSSHL